MKNTKKTKKNTSKNYNLYLIILGIIILTISIILILNKDKNWVQDGNTISKGNKKYEIGDYYEYDETNNGKITGLTDVKWKVLGVDDGNLLIMSASSIGSLTLGSSSDLEKSKQDYLNGSNLVNEMTKNYGQGKGATSVRSFTNADLAKLSNIDESNKNDIEYTYYWSDEENPISISNDGTKNSIKLSYKSYFIWYDKTTKNWIKTEKTGNETSANPTKITSAKNTLFTIMNYIADEYIIEPNSKIFKMVYLNDNGEREMYWTDNTYVNVSPSYIAYGQNVVLYDGINYRHFLYSNGVPREETAGIRAVVTID